MSEILSACKYQGEGIGLSVKFIGLCEDNYDELSIALGDGAFVTVERDADFSFRSTPAEFCDLSRNEVYLIRGRILCNGSERFVQCHMVAREAFLEVFGPFIRHGGALGATPPKGGG